MNVLRLNEWKGDSWPLDYENKAMNVGKIVKNKSMNVCLANVGTQTARILVIDTLLEELQENG